MKKYEVILRHDNLIVLGHKINQIGVLPGVALIDLVYRTLKGVMLIESTSLVNCLFHEAISFQQSSEKKIRLVFDDTVTPSKVDLYSQDVGQTEQWILNFEGYLTPSNTELHQKTIDVESIKKNCSPLYSMSAIYQGLRSVGIMHDDFMQVMGEIYESNHSILLELTLSEKARAYLDKFSLHPAMLDAATIGSIIPIYQDITESKHAYIPLSIEHFKCVNQLPSHCYVLIHKQEVSYLNDIMKASFSIYDSNGTLLVEVKNLVNKKIRNRLLQRETLEEKISSEYFTPKVISDNTKNLETFSQLTPQLSIVREKIVSLLKEYIPESIGIQGTESFYQLGLDSQSLISIVHKLEKVTNAQLYPTLLFEYNNLEKLSQYLLHHFPTLAFDPVDEVFPKNMGYSLNQAIHLLVPTWMELPWPRLESDALFQNKIKELLILTEDAGQIEQLRNNPDVLKSQIRVIQILQGSTFCVVNENTYQVNQQNEQDFQRLFDSLWAQGIVPKHIIDCRRTPHQPDDLTSIFQVAQLLKSIQQLRVKSLRYLLCYSYDEHSINLMHAVTPYFKSLQLEEPGFHYQLIAEENINAKICLEDLLFGFYGKQDAAHFLLRAKKCYELNYEELPTVSQQHNSIMDKHNSVFVISGGAGKIGLAIANYLIREKNASVYLLGRAHSPPMDVIRALESLPDKIKYISCDVSKRSELQLFFQGIKSQSIDAVFHCAGVLKDALHENTEQAVFEAILQPKWEGTRLLYEFCAELHIKHLFLFSSLTSVMGNIGQTQYATANALLDEFARLANIKHRERAILPHVLAINWPLWDEGGMVRFDVKEMLKNKWGLEPLTTPKAIQIIQMALASTHPQVVVSNDKIKQYLAVKSETTTVVKKPISISDTGNSDIAIIGLSGRYPLAQSLEEFWVNLCAAKDCVTSYPKERFSHSSYPFGGFLEGVDRFDPLFFGISPKDAKVMDPQERLFLQTAWQTFEDAGYGQELRREYHSIGVFVGAMFSLYQLYGKSNPHDAPQLANSSFASIANRVSYCLDLNGPSLTLDTMCSSSLTALHYACESVRSGECQLALVGGVNIISHQSKYDELLQRGFLSKEGQCKVFSAKADGYVPGEGVGAVLIKSLASAVKDNDHIYGVIKGSAMNHSGKSDGYTVPSIEYQSKLIRRVLDKTNIHPASISYIEAHGTGTALGDPIELQAIANAYKHYHEQKQYCAIGSVKSNIGHLESAAGIAGLTKILLQFKHQKLVPSIHVSPINPAINIQDSPCFIQDKLSDWEITETPRRAALSGFGAGGTNVHVILEEHTKKTRKHRQDPSVLLFVFSAKTEKALLQFVNHFYHWLCVQKESIDLQDVSLTLALGRDHFQHRAALVANSLMELKTKLGHLSQNKQNLEMSVDVHNENILRLAHDYLQGKHIDWRQIYANKEWRKMPLPTYSFEEESYWIATKPPLDELSLNFYTYQWMTSGQDIMPIQSFLPEPTTQFVIVDLDSTRYEILRTHGFDRQLVLITPGDEVRQLTSNHYELDFKSLDRCQEIIKKIGTSKDYHRVVIFHCMSDQNLREETSDSFNAEFETAFLNFHFLCQVLLHAALPISIDIKYFYHTDSIRPVCAAISAYLKTIMRENTKLTGQVIKINRLSPAAEYFAEVVKMELSDETFKAVDVAYSSHLRYFKSFERVNDLVLSTSPKSFVEKNGVYLIIGGLGKLGLIFGNYLASLQTVHLILVGRKSVDEHWVKNQLKLDKTSSTVDYYACDVAQYDAVMTIIGTIKAKYSKINGIINSSSVLAFSPVYHKSAHEISNTIATKCIGTNNLDLATYNERLDWFICFSSLAATIGFPEGCDYAFGNAYLDEFALKRNQLVQEGKRYGRTIVFNWPVWQDGGMIKKNIDTQQSWEDWMIKSQGVVPMNRERGLEAFEKVMQSDFSQMIIAEGYDLLIQKTLNDGFKLPRREDKHIAPTEPVAKSKTTSLGIQTLLIDTISELLEIPKIKVDLHTSFSDFGFDSMSLITLSERLTQELKIDILPSLFFSENSIDKLTKHLNHYEISNETQVLMKKPVASGLEHAFTDQQPLRKPTIELLAETDIAIVGMDGKFPDSSDLDSFWQNLVNGADLISEIPADRWSWRDYYQEKADGQHSHSKWGGFLPDIQSFDASFFKISDTEASMMDPQHRLFLEVAWRAIENAGQAPEALQGKPIGVFVGVQFNDYQNTLFENNKTHFYIATGNSHALIANRLSHLLDLSGPSESIDTACSSALVAINRAINAIRLGECESAIVGSTTCILNPMSYVVTSQLGIISPEGRCHVFDEKANGYVKGEGVGVLWLMPLKMAKALNYPIHGIIKGIGVNHGGKSSSLTAPNIKAQQQLLVDTYKKANISMDSISFIETHGTGTLLGDSVEIESIKAASQELASLNSTKTVAMDCFLGAVKSNAGHLEPAAGMIGIMKVLLMLKNSIKVKNLNLTELSPYIKLEGTRFKIQKETETWGSYQNHEGKTLAKRAGVSSFGFGGTNAHVILEEYTEPHRLMQQNKPYYLCTLSAKAESILFQRIDALKQVLMNHPLDSIEDISYTLNVGRSHYPYRCAIVVESVPALIAALSLIGKNAAGENVYFSSEIPLETVNSLHQGMLDYLQHELTKTILESAGYFKLLNQLAALYVLKLDLNWEILHANESKKRVSLPSYPFLKTKHWVEVASVSKTPKKVIAKNLSTFNAYFFELDLDVNAFYFYDHKVNGTPVLPGVLVLEIVHSAIQSIFPQQSSLRIKSIHWFKPVHEQALQEKLGIRLKPSPQGLHFELVGLHQHSNVFSKGEIEFSMLQRSAEPVSLDNLKARFVDGYPSAEIYKRFSANGIDYGISFQSIINAYRCQNEVLAEIRLPGDIAVSQSSWAFHPCLIDAALQSSILLFEFLSEGGYLYALEEIYLFKELSLHATYFAHLQKTDEGSISLKLYDDKGGLSVSIAKIVIKLQTKTPSSLSCLTTRWVESPLVVSSTLKKSTQALIITTVGAKEKEVSDAIIRSSSHSQVSVWEWGKMNEVKQHDFEDIYIIFNESCEVNEWVSTMTRCTHELLLFLSTLGKQGVACNLHVRFITINTLLEPSSSKSSPISVALTGLVHSFHQEKPHVHVSCMDISLPNIVSLELGKMIKNEPQQQTSTFVAINEDAKRFVRLFSLHAFPALELMSYRQQGAYLIVGGANGVGFEYSQFLAQHYHARLVLVGRSPEAEQAHKLITIHELGGEAFYCQADVGDLPAIAGVFEKAYQKYGVLNGVIHSALVLDDKTMDKIDLSSIERVFRPKILGTMNLLRLLKESTLDFFLIFSSAQSYMNNGGQSMYAAASLFQDELAKRLRRDVDFPIKVVNWGYWGQVGIVATEYYQQQMRQKGVLSIHPKDAFRMLEQFLMSSLDDCVLLSATPDVIKKLTTLQTVSVNESEINRRELDKDFLALEQFTAQLLFASFRQQGYFNGDRMSYRVDDLLASLSVKLSYQPLFMSILSILDKSKWIHYDQAEGLIHCITPPMPLEVEASELMNRYPLLSAHIELVCRCTSSLFLILNGQMRHTEVLFSGNQFHLLEKVYSAHPISQATTQRLIDIIITAVKEFNQENPSVRFNLLEVGAGTGSASVAILQALRKNHLRINYIFTDLSEAFLQQARLNPRLQDDGLQLKRLDISCDPLGQGFEAQSIDLVFANNVVHATGSIAQSLENIRGLLKGGGIILLNELTQSSHFLTATFGLTPEWWKFDLKEETIINSPLLSLVSWKKILARLNYSAIQTPLVSELHTETLLCEAQQVIFARNTAHPTKFMMEDISMVQQQSLNDTELMARLEKYLKTLFSDILRVPVVDINNHINLGDYGLDSLVTLEATGRLQKVFKQFSNTVLFEYATIERLMHFLIKHYYAEVTHLFNMQVSPPLSLVFEDKVDSQRRVVREDDIAVIGFSGRFPGAETIEAFWDLLLNQKVAITDTPTDRPFEFSKVQRGGFLKNVEAFDALAFNISPREAVKMDPQERLFLESCWELLERSGYTKAHLSKEDLNIGTFVGAMNTDYSLYTFTDNQETHHNYSALWSVANRVSYFFNLTGPSLTIDTACASSLTAIHMACQSLRQDECQLAIAGGVNLILHPNHYAMLDETNMLSKKRSCSPFSEDSDGMIIGEGVGALLLKPLSEAIKDHDKVYAVIKGSHINSSGKTKGYMVPNPHVQETLMNKALKRAGLDATEISFVETQGTGTKLGDEIEIEALQRVYGKDSLIIGTLKPNLGHLESAAGVAGIIKILLQMQHKILVPAVGGKETNQGALLKNSSFSLPEQQDIWKTEGGMPRRAAISAFGAGGSNAHVILEEFVETPLRACLKKPYYLFLISAKNDDSLTFSFRKLYHYLETRLDLPLEDIAYTLALRRNHHAYRGAMIVSSMEELLMTLKAVTEGKPLGHVWRSETKAPINSTSKPLDVGTLLVESQSRESYFNKLTLLAKGYTLGTEINWGDFFQSQDCQLVELPTYSFIPQRYWSTDLLAVNKNDLIATQKKSPTLVTQHEQIEDYLLTLISEVLNISKDVLDTTENLIEYGFDSITLAYLISAIESHFHVSITPVVVMEHSTVTSLAGYLESQVQMLAVTSD